MRAVSRSVRRTAKNVMPSADQETFCQKSHRRIDRFLTGYVQRSIAQRAPSN